MNICDTLNPIDIYIYIYYRSYNIIVVVGLFLGNLNFIIKENNMNRVKIFIHNNFHIFTRQQKFSDNIDPSSVLTPTKYIFNIQTYELTRHMNKHGFPSHALSNRIVSTYRAMGSISEYMHTNFLHYSNINFSTFFSVSNFSLFLTDFIDTTHKFSSVS